MNNNNIIVPRITSTYRIFFVHSPSSVLAIVQKVMMIDGIFIVSRELDLLVVRISAQVQNMYTCRRVHI